MDLPLWFKCVVALFVIIVFILIINMNDGFDTYTGFEHLEAEKKSPFDKYITPYVNKIVGNDKKDQNSGKDSGQQSAYKKPERSERRVLTTRKQKLEGYPKKIKITVTDATGKLIQKDAYINDGNTISGIITSKNGKPAGIITISDDNTAKVQLSRQFTTDVNESKLYIENVLKHESDSSSGYTDDFVVYLKNGVMDDNQQMHGNLKDKLKCSLLYVDKDTFFAKINDADEERSMGSLKVKAGLKLLLTYDNDNIHKKYIFDVNLL